MTNGAGFATFRDAVHRHRIIAPKHQQRARSLVPKQWQLMINPNGPSTSGSASTVIYTGKLFVYDGAAITGQCTPTIADVSVCRCVARAAIGLHGQSHRRRCADRKADIWRGCDSAGITFAPSYLAPPQVVVGGSYDKDGSFGAWIAQDAFGTTLVTTSFCNHSDRGRADLPRWMPHFVYGTVA